MLVFATEINTMDLNGFLAPLRLFCNPSVPNRISASNAKSITALYTSFKKSETLLVEIRCETSRAAGIRIHSRIIDWMRDSTGPHFVGCDAEEVGERGGADRDRHMPGRIVFSISEVVFLVLRDVVWHG